ncbi:acyl-CoA dehydrogenase [Mycobacterium sp. Root135]|uniref:acyl-CoA dehydrogenase family protein n=1 Tax=Mycobacterium sp. Root135 TaxID=1736457 RepID=UPI0006F8B05A|nr:acyl-CoA dehydrogenase family protein [Mycobacterium sp. Root135]KQY06927.1 acyl-CoA dehydrogenase [Mycobacterium sp. Root135]
MNASQTELDELRSAIRKFLQTRLPEAALPGIADGKPLENDLWSDLNTSLGLHSLAIPERFGGDGADLVVMSVVFEELGRAVAPVPYFSSFVAIHALLLSGDEEHSQRLLTRVAAGEGRPTIAIAERDGSWDAATISTRATSADDGTWTLTGKKTWVLDASGADVILVLARTTAGPTLFNVRPDASGTAVEPMRVIDETRPLFTLELQDTPAELVGREGGGGHLLARLLDVTVLALCAEQVGIAQRCLDISVEYAKTRTQFGRPIGSFQAVKHLCAEMLAHVEMARAATEDAIHEAESGQDTAAVAAAAAHVTCSAAAMFAAKEMIQVLGGIGFTWDHPAHVYFRRAASSQLLLGGPAVSHERLLERMGI